MYTRIKPTLVLFLFLLISTFCQSQGISIIPEPVSVAKKDGHFLLTASTIISHVGGKTDLSQQAAYLQKKLSTATGYNLEIKTGSQSGIVLSILAVPDKQLGSEGYLLDVESGNVSIRANSATGIFYGIQSFLQLLPPEIESDLKVTNIKWIAPAVAIRDYPRIGYRGLMLDVSRHFYTKEEVKKWLDRMSRYKLNKFHWHLTDDNGWRLEIKSYPKLTEVGAFRVPRTGTFGTNTPPKPGEAPTYGGFYTQEDVKEIIKYAQALQIEVIPEIDVPGHSMALLASYPELSVSKTPDLKVNPGTEFATWFGDGTFKMHIDNTLNPSDEKVYQFLDKVFTEVATLFPSEYIHMGGDECYHGYWTSDPTVQAFMKKNKLEDGLSLQAYFNSRISKIIASKKRKMIGWDEILEKSTDPTSIIMSWRGIKGGVEASHQKHKVIMSPNPYYYLDYLQGDKNIEAPVYNSSLLLETYQFNPWAKEMDTTYLMGIQGNLWSEQTPTFTQAEYMTYPRALAIAETGWTPASRKNWPSFVARVENHFTRFEQMKRDYSPSIYDPKIKVTDDKAGKLTIELIKEIESVDYYYTLDNAIPNTFHPLYSAPIEVPEDVDFFKVQSYRNGKPIGRLMVFKIEDLKNRIR